MLLKLVNIDSFTIFSGVKSVNHYQNIYTAFLMNNKGETIEKIR